MRGSRLVAPYDFGLHGQRVYIRHVLWLYARKLVRTLGALLWNVHSCQPLKCHRLRLVTQSAIIRQAYCLAGRRIIGHKEWGAPKDWSVLACAPRKTQPVRRSVREHAGELIYLAIKALARFNRVAHCMGRDLNDQSNRRDVGW